MLRSEFKTHGWLRQRAACFLGGVPLGPAEILYLRNMGTVDESVFFPGPTGVLTQDDLGTMYRLQHQRDGFVDYVCAHPLIATQVIRAVDPTFNGDVWEGLYWKGIWGADLTITSILPPDKLYIITCREPHEDPLVQVVRFAPPRVRA